MRENVNQNNSEYGQLLRSVIGDGFITPKSAHFVLKFLKKGRQFRCIGLLVARKMAKTKINLKVADMRLSKAKG